MIEPMYYFVTRYKDYYIIGERSEPTLYAFVEGDESQKGYRHDGKWLIRTEKTYAQLLRK